MNCSQTTNNLITKAFYMMWNSTPLEVRNQPKLQTPQREFKEFAKSYKKLLATSSCFLVPGLEGFEPGYFQLPGLQLEYFTTGRIIDQSLSNFDKQYQESRQGKKAPISHDEGRHVQTLFKYVKNALKKSRITSHKTHNAPWHNFS